jgi:recombination protein RecR
VTKLAPPLERLIHELSKLPGVGPKTAQRLAFHILKVPREDALALARAIEQFREDIRVCERCFNLAEGELCPICADASRDVESLCIVEEPMNILALEKTGTFRGLYHVLGGALSPLKDVGPDQLRTRELIERVGSGAFREVILATNPDVEGEATAVYLARLLKPSGVRVTRLAQGMPAGGDLEYIDELTLRRALEGRREY